MLLSFLLVIIFTLSNQQCPIFKCSSSSLSNNQCISYNPSENTYLISLCPSNQLCDYFTNPSKTEIFCSDREKKLLVDTEQCTSNSDCYSNNCQSGKCKGKEKNDSCGLTEECAIGFYCKGSKCIAQEEEGNTCNEDSDCINNCGCSPDKKCIKYFSLDIGESTNNYLLCKTLYMQDEVCASIKLNNDTDECSTENNVCSYTINEGKVVKETEKKCQCTRGDHSKKYCPSDTEGKIWNNMLDKVTKFYKSNDNLHTIRRHQFDYEKKKEIYYAVNYPKYKDVDSCAIDIDLSSTKEQLNLLILFVFIFSIFI